MQFDKRTKIFGAIGAVAIAIGVGVGSTVPTRIASLGDSDPKLASLMSARSPGLRTSAAVSSKQPIVQPAVFTPTMAPAAQVLGERTPMKVASVAPQVATPLAPAVLAPPPAIAPAVAAAAVPAAIIPAALPAAAGGGSALAGLAALPLIPTLIGGGGGGGFTVSVAPAVPEPATWLMMILGFGVVGSALRRQRRRDLKDGVALSPDMNPLARTA